MNESRVLVLFRRALIAATLALLAVPLLLVADAGVPELAAPSPSPTPCRVLYVNYDGTMSCLAMPTYGMEPIP